MSRNDEKGGADSKAARFAEAQAATPLEQLELLDKLLDLWIASNKLNDAHDETGPVCAEHAHLWQAFREAVAALRRSDA